jgi:hypothetical protein
MGAEAGGKWRGSVAGSWSRHCATAAIGQTRVATVLAAPHIRSYDPRSTGEGRAGSGAHQSHHHLRQEASTPTAEPVNPTRLRPQPFWTRH